MTDAHHKRLSRFLSLVLRHKPQTINLDLDDKGWAEVDDLIAKVRASGRKLDRPSLERLVATNDKKRFTLSDDGRRIRAAQGHSIPVDLDIPPKAPPSSLYHGTADRFLNAILAEGLKPRSRRQVHLSMDLKTARTVGARHGRPVILKVDAAAMARDGLLFYQAENGVWLTDTVPPAYLSRQDL